MEITYLVESFLKESGFQAFVQQVIHILGRVSKVVVQISYLVCNLNAVSQASREVIIKFFQLYKVSFEVIKVKLLLIDELFVLSIILNLYISCRGIQLFDSFRFIELLEITENLFESV